MAMTDDTVVFYVPGKPGIVDVVVDRPAGVTGAFSLKTHEELALRHPGLIVGRMGDVEKASKALFRKPPEEITRDRFMEMLEILPPDDWRNTGRTESFKLCERTYNSITAIFVRVGDRYFTLQDDCTLPHKEVVSRVEKMIEGGNKPALPDWAHDNGEGTVSGDF